ncbi:uncharacterized protein ColSpa_01190 [Colletotrichum spaethianum]|uniref:2EXR domain-containing protein n=1 Tax=Colletotrichum spaethianum TaxID=700344 RepID=A0AA37L6R3_9PEZI|nr:uncharacterized protein ColSpa_01190 [Colletotrichum spaethianum]GKT41009.1 hypothetical protein ColSpa_01190 [Colletotrichum spaethianum]
MTTATTATFHPFLHLPAKLRARIWELTVEPRVVEVRVLYHQPSPTDVEGSELVVKWPPRMRYLCSPTPAPAQLQTCREAREHLTTCPDSGFRFEKAFSELATTPHNGPDPVSEGGPRQERYVWFNFDNDMLSIGKTDLHEFRAVAYQIRRLRLRRVISDEYFSRTESLLISRWFRNLTEIHLICPEGIRAGYLMTEDMDFSCGPQDVYFVDLEEMGRTMMNSIDLDAMVIREDEELYGPGEHG